MATLPVSPAIPDLGVPRWQPCIAFTGPATKCGATPSALYRVFCGVLGHTEEKWLCPVHAMICNSGLAICKRCADRNGRSIVSIERISPEIRLP